MDEHSREGVPATGMMKIARLSEAAGVSKSTIHNYVRKGLLPPPQKVGLNLHLYSQQHVERLREIRRLREEGKLSIGEIMDVFTSAQPPATDPQGLGNGIPEGGPLGETQMRTEETREKRQQIVESAIDLFNRIGYERVRIGDITDSLNMGKGTFYLYFHNKEELLSECLTSLGGLVSLRTDIKNKIHATNDFLERTRARFIGFQEQYDRFSGILNLMRSASCSSDPEISKRAREAYDTIVGPLRKDVQTAVKEGTVRSIDEELAAYALLGAGDYLCYRATFDRRYSSQEIEKFVRRWVESALRPIQPSRGEQGEARGCPGRLVDLDGTSTELGNVLFDGEPRLRGHLGRAAIELDPARVESIVVRESDSTCAAEVTMRDGGTAALQIQGHVVVSGETALGTVRIPLRDVSNLTFDGSAARGISGEAPSC